MAKKKRTPKSKILRFPEVRGKIVAEVEVDSSTILILFADGLALSFNIEASHAVFPELSKRKSGNWTPVKKWKAVSS
jgi:hypothetical protein